MKIICLNSGVGARMIPLSYNTHKSMIPFNGIPTIVNSINVINKAFAVSNDSVDEVVFVTSQEFWDKYSNQIIQGSCVKVTPVINRYNEVYNNWYSMKLALNYLNDKNDLGPFISVEGDLYIDKSFSKILSEQSLSENCYFCKYSEKEWVFCQTPQGKTKVVKNGNGLAMSGVVMVNYGYNNLLNSLNTKNHEKYKYWDDVLVEELGDTLKPVRVPRKTIKEFDTMRDLIDSEMISSLDIAKLTSDDGNAEPLDSMTNTNFLITFRGEKKVLRLPGSGTDDFIDRAREMNVYDKVSLDLTPGVTFFSMSGVKMTNYIENSRASVPEDSPQVLNLLGQLHRDSPDLFSQNILIDLVSEIFSYEEIYSNKNIKEPCRFREVMKFYLDKIIELQNKEMVLCHRNLDPRNVLITENKSYLLDFEYAGLLNRYWDLGAHLAELRVFFDFKPDETYKSAIEEYDKITGFKTDFDKVLLWSGIVDFVWSCWSLAKISLGEDYTDYLNKRWESACKIYEEFCPSTI